MQTQLHYFFLCLFLYFFEWNFPDVSEIILFNEFALFSLTFVAFLVSAFLLTTFNNGFLFFFRQASKQHRLLWCAVRGQKSSVSSGVRVCVHVRVSVLTVQDLNNKLLVTVKSNCLHETATKM